MNQTVVIYKSKYGATAAYATWLGEILDCEVLENKHITVQQLERFQTIILGGGLYAGGIAGLSLLKKNPSLLQGKQVRIFGVGASPADESILAELHSRVGLPGIPIFYFRGKWQESKMKFLDQTLCSMLKKSLLKKDPASYEPWEKALAEASGSDWDWTSKEQLAPLLESLHLK